MQQMAVSDVGDEGATVPRVVLRALGASSGDKVAFVERDDGSISLVKAPPTPARRRPIADFVGAFATGKQRTLEEELALLHELRYGDERPGDL
jgi:bifunctional DNA-binding transcriptional regulator/antitoxin component of YhaV-PrlF toxin-antitoxin module